MDHITLDHYIFINGYNNRSWLKFGHLAVYIRKSIRYKEPCLDIANVSVNQKHQNKGIFIKFLEIVEAKNIPIFVENVLTERFANFFLKRGYEQVNQELPKCFWRIKWSIQK